ncbi:MAG: hypothetical protein JST89_11335 [Cyanobacteria bacterium SZAS-4]|nr:hypothetical protein [Cyanobacteria bacterium SZAS-4]
MTGKRNNTLTAWTILLLGTVQQTFSPMLSAESSPESSLRNTQLSQGVAAASENAASTNTGTADSNLVEPPFVLKPASDGGLYGVVLAHNNSDFYLSPEDRILKIDDTFTKGRPIEALQKLLKGKSGTSLTLTVLTARSNELATHTVIRNTDRPKIPGGAYTAMLGAFDVFDRPTRFHASLMMAKNSADRGTNLFAGALLKDLLNYRPYVHPATSEPEIVVALPFAISFFDRCGMVAESDSAIKFATNASKVSLKNRSKSEISALCEAADYLRRTKRLEQANTIWSNLYATVGDAKISEQIKCLTGYAKFLSENSKYGDATPRYERAVTLSKNNPSTVASASLSDAADFYLSRKNYELAEKTSRSLADMQKSLADKTFDKLYQNQKFVQAISKLADALAASGHYAEAVASLQLCLSAYDDSYSAEEIVRLERATNPCYSQLETRIGELEIKDGKPEQARKFLQSAVARIEGSLGTNAPQLKAPLAALASIEQNADEARKLQSRSENLEPLRKDSPGDQTDLDFLQSRSAFNAIKSKSFKLADAEIRKLIDATKKQTTFDPYSISRLIALANAYGTNVDNNGAVAILRQLVPLTEPDDSLSDEGQKCLAIRSQVLAEIAIRTNSDSDWRELDKCLYDLQNTAFPRMAGRNRDSDRDASYNSQQNSADRLVKFAVGFRFSGRPKDAIVMLETAQQKLKSKSPIWKQACAELALCQIELKDYQAASKTFADSIDSSADTNWNDKTIQVADAYISQNQKSSAESVVNTIVLALQNQKTIYERPRLFTIVGSLEYRLGNYAQADKYFRKATEGTEAERTRQSATASVDFGAVLEHEGKVDEATTEYLNAANAEANNHFSDTGPLNIALSKALKILIQKPNIDSETMLLLNQAVARSAPAEESSLVSNQLIQVAKNQSTNLSNLVGLQAVRAILEHEKQLDMVASLKISPQKTGADISSKQSSKGDSTTKTTAEESATSAQSNVVDVQKDRDLIAAELQNKNYEKAADYVVAMLQDDAKNKQSQLMNHPGNRIADLCLKAFEDANRLDLAEKVLKKAVEIEPSRTPYAGGALNSALLADIYAKDHKSTESLASAELVLGQFEKYPDQIIVNQSRECSSSISVLMMAIESLEKAKDYDAAERLNNRLSDFFHKHVGPKNEAFIKVAENFATIFGAKGNKKMQEQKLREALKLSDWNWGANSSRQADLRTKLASLLREGGRATEADQMQRVDAKYVRQPDGKLLYGNDYGFSSHSPPPERYADSAEPALLDWLDQTRATTGECSQQTMDVVSNLLDYYYAREQYGAASKLVKKKLEAWESIEGASSDMQSHCMQELAVICFLEKNKKGAEELLKMAQDANVFNRTSNTVPIAALYLEMGNRAVATRLLLSAAKKFEETNESPVWNESFTRCIYLLACVDQKAEVEKFTAQYEKAVAPMKAYRHGLGYGWNRNNIDPRYELVDGVWVRKTRAIAVAQQEAQMASYRAHPSEGQIKSQKASMERLKERLPADVARRYAEGEERRAQAAIVKSDEAEAHKQQVEQADKLLHDYATARIVALQQALASRGR